MIGVTIVFYALIGVIMLVVRTIIAVWIYEDAKKYGLNSVFCALMSILLPLLISILVYGLMRQKKEEVIYCNQCKKIINKKYNYCPECRNQISNECNHCQYIIKRIDKFCPYCGGQNEEYIGLVKKRNNKVKVYILIISIQVGIILVGLGAVLAMNTLQKYNNEKIAKQQIEIIKGIGVGSLDVKSGENEDLTQIEGIIQRKTGKETGVLKALKGENTIQAQFNVKEGNAEIIIKRENEEVIFNKKYKEAQIDNIALECKKEETLEVIIIFDKYMGNFKVSLME